MLRSQLATGRYIPAYPLGWLRREVHKKLGARLLSMPARAPAQLPAIDVEKCMPLNSIRQFQEEGAIVLRSVLNDDWVEALRAAAEANMRSPGPLCDEHAAAQGTGGRFHDDQ